MPKKRNTKGTVAVVVRGGTLSLRWRTGGKQYRLALGIPNSPTGKKLAKAKALEIQKDIAFGDFDLTLKKYRPNDTQTKVLSTPELFEQFIESRRKDGTSGQTISAKYAPMLSNMRRFGQDIVGDKEARDFVAMLRNRQSARTANQSLTMLKGFGLWCIDADAWTQNHFTKIKPLKDSGERVQNREPFTREEISKIFEAIKSHSKSAHFYDFALFLLSLGIRPSEAIGIRWQHVDFAKGQVTIRESLSRGPDGRSSGRARQRKKTKTENIRTLPLSPMLSKMLWSYRTAETQEDDLIFTDPNGIPIDDQKFRKNIWKPACERAKVTYRPPYTSRHTLLSHGIEYLGWTLPQAAKIAGHANTRQIAETYGKAIETPEFPEFQ
ncbi:MAG: tyrosine-type recombinase/integrase [Cyanobacteria bacterium P01_F01_bin.150]